jgi:hypothetical protein
MYLSIGGWDSGIARLRNGDLQSGIPAVVSHDKRFGGLMVNFPFLEQAVTDFGRLRNNQKQETTHELTKELLNPKHTRAVLYIASILKWPELIKPLWESWVNLEQETKLETLATMVWFLSGYDNPSITPKLETALKMSLKISNVSESPGHMRERVSNFVDPLRLVLERHTISDSAVKVWVKTISENEELRKSMGYLLGGIDHPASLDAYIRYEKNTFSIWGETSEYVDPMVNDKLLHGYFVKSDETRNHLWEIVFQENDQSIRRTAFGFLSKAAKPSDLLKLQSITTEDSLFENAVKLRLRLRDKTATTLLIERINKDPNEWCRFSPLLAYEPGVFDALLNNLEMIPTEHGFYNTNSIFYRLPAEKIKQIVLAKAKILLDSPETWSALWLSGEETALKFVVRAIKQAKGNARAEAHLEHFFFSFGSDHPVHQRMLDSLLPVLDCFPKDGLRFLAMLTLRNGFGKWAIKNLDGTLKSTDWGSFKWVYIDNVITTLSEAAQYLPDGWDAVNKKSGLRALEFSYEDRDKYGYVANPVDAVKIWLKDSPSSDNLVIAARIMSRFGSSNDIEWWLTQKPSGEKPFTIWNNALYHLRRRRWQSI